MLFLCCNLAGCVYKGEAGQLILHYETGFRLVQSVTRATIWQYPFHKLRSSADDGKRLLWLDFGPDQPDIVSSFFFLFT